MKRDYFINRVLRSAGIFTGGFIILTVSFYFWGTSGNLTKEELSKIIEYQEKYTPEEENIYSIMTYNIGYLSGMVNNLPVREELTFYQSNMEKVLKLFSEIKPNFIGFQEIDFNSKRSYFINQLDTIAEEKEYGYSAYSINWDKNYIPFPYWPLSVQFGKMLSGQAVLSRYKILENTLNVLSKPLNTPFYYNAFYLDRIAQVTKINVNKKTLVIINVHLEAFDQKTRESQAGVVYDLYNRYAEDFPVLLIGDFNCMPPFASRINNFPDSPNIDFSDEKTMEIFFKGNNIKEAIPFEVYKENEKATFTYPSEQPNRRLDYIFYNPSEIKPLIGYVSSLAGTASDHLPVVFQFSFRN